MQLKTQITEEDILQFFAALGLGSEKEFKTIFPLANPSESYEPAEKDYLIGLSDSSENVYFNGEGDS